MTSIDIILYCLFLERFWTFLGFPCDSAGKESVCNAGDLGSIPGLGRSPGEGKGYTLQYSCLENSMDCMVYGVAKDQTLLSNFLYNINIIMTLFVHPSTSVQNWKVGL